MVLELHQGTAGYHRRFTGGAAGYSRVLRGIWQGLWISCELLACGSSRFHTRLYIPFNDFVSL